MAVGLATAFYLVAIVLLVISAVPPVPYGTTLARLGVAFAVAGLMVGGA